MNHARLAEKLRPVILRVYRRRYPIRAALPGWLGILAALLPIILQVLQLFIARQVSGADPLAAPDVAVDEDVRQEFEAVFPPEAP